MFAIGRSLTALASHVPGYAPRNGPGRRPRRNIAAEFFSGAGIPLWIRIILRICLWFCNRNLVDSLYEESQTELFEQLRLEIDPSKLSTSSALRAPEPEAPESFPQFPLLPPELRNMIWAEAIPGPRLLLLRPPKQLTTSNRPSTRYFHPYRWLLFHHRQRAQRLSQEGFTCATPPPSMLHVNTESRAIALGHYRLGLAAPRGQPKVYFNPKRDIIGVPLDVMRTARARRLFRSTPDLRRVRRFCVAAPPPPDARGVRIVQRFLDGAEVWSVLTFSAHEVVVVDSAMVAYGVVPRIAGLDWEYWVRWMMIRGCARYVVVKEEGDKDDDGDEEEELDYDASGEDGGDDEIVEEEEEEEEDWSD